ncbi:MAG: hypothetical protein HY005_00685, partial [Candidatus Staskawiczbacteria bacterium]|nr:hypothetical protein [Candidatus Staskawiczbacteria bacterium]
YLNARYYNSNIGRFISQDPMFWTLPVELLTDPQNQNSYAYARNNPIVGSDPSGESAEVVIKSLFPITGAHGDIEIHPEPGSSLGETKYTIGGYISGSNPFTNKLIIEVNNPGAYDYPESRVLARIPLGVPEGMTFDQYDQALTNSSNNLSKQGLGEYTFTGRPLSTGVNSGNAWTQVVINAGGTVPAIQKTYYAPGILGKNTPYFPLGSGTSLYVPSYRQQAITAVNNTINSAREVVLSKISSAISDISSRVEVLKSKLRK